MKYNGQCVCGDVTFACEGEPLFTQYCHCNKCREVASHSRRESDKIGHSFTAAYLTNKLSVTSKTKLDEIIKNNAKLLRCANCKSLIYGISLYPNLQAGIGINANNFTFSLGLPEAFKPIRHIWYDSHVVTMHDDLPKYKNAPKEQFGDGELFIE